MASLNDKFQEETSFEKLRGYGVARVEGIRWRLCRNELSYFVGENPTSRVRYRFVGVFGLSFRARYKVRYVCLLHGSLRCSLRGSLKFVTGSRCEGDSLRSSYQVHDIREVGIVA